MGAKDLKIPVTCNWQIQQNHGHRHQLGKRNIGVPRHLGAEIGSITCGKHADFAVLDRDPLAAGQEGLKDAQVLGTVLGGRVQMT